MKIILAFLTMVFLFYAALIVIAFPRLVEQIHANGLKSFVECVWYGQDKRK